MAPERRTVEVWASWRALNARMGVLSATPTRGKEIFAFEYDAAWLAGPDAAVLDPSLALVRGPQYLPSSRDNFGLFLDSSPDRWGRVLLQRREALLAREGKRAEKRLAEIDYLLGVFDGHRMGGLRFCLPGGPFLDDNLEYASPPWTSLRDLEHASLELERDGAEKKAGYAKWLRMLIAPGRSLGGARPKASVLDERRCLWIAKFPSANDRSDIGAWESVVHVLARNGGIATPEARREKFASKHHTFLSRRFDRTSTDERIHFASAMTLLDRVDGDADASYLHLAALLIQSGANPGRDLEELWRRIVFNMCVSNVDDHLRNHGFLLSRAGWSLAPAYDMNPIASGDGLTLNVSETDNAQNLELALDVSAHFRLKPTRAKSLIAEVKTAASKWRAEAKKAGISRAEQEQMADAFRLSV